MTFLADEVTRNFLGDGDVMCLHCMLEIFFSGSN
jgi:hypothetical protein